MDRKSGHLPAPPDKTGKPALKLSNYGSTRLLEAIVGGVRTDETITEVDSFLKGLPDPVRQVARGEWGFTVQAAGWPLDVGLAVRDGLFRVQAQVVGPGQISESELLWWNRRIHLVRFSQTQSGEVWLCCDLLPDSINARQLDRVLGLFVLTAAQARASVADA